MVTGAWYGEPQLKAMALKRLEEHRRLDQLGNLKQGFGYYSDGWGGCQLGCLTHACISGDVHDAMERMFAIPGVVACWLEGLFERVDDPAAWAMQSTKAIPVGADLEYCTREMFKWLNKDHACYVGKYGNLGLRLAFERRDRAYSEIATKSLEIFRAAPIITGNGIPQEVQQELCCKQLYCPTGELVKV